MCPAQVEWRYCKKRRNSHQLQMMDVTAILGSTRSSYRPALVTRSRLVKEASSSPWCSALCGWPLGPLGARSRLPLDSQREGWGTTACKVVLTGWAPPTTRRAAAAAQLRSAKLRTHDDWPDFLLQPHIRDHETPGSIRGSGRRRRRRRRRPVPVSRHGAQAAAGVLPAGEFELSRQVDWAVCAGEALRKRGDLD